MDKGEGGLLGAHTVLRPELDLLASISEAGSSVLLTSQPLLLLSEGCEPFCLLKLGKPGVAGAIFFLFSLLCSHHFLFCAL